MRATPPAVGSRGRVRRWFARRRLEIRGPWILSPRAFWIVFLSLGIFYILVLFPDELNRLTLEELESVVQAAPVTFLDRAYLPLDSANYLSSAHQSLATILHDAVAFHHLGFGLFSNVSIILLGKLALTIWPAKPLYVIFVANTFLLGGTIVQCRAICRRLDVELGRFLPFLLVNPLVLFMTFTLNKETVGMFLVAGMVRYGLERRLWALAPLVVVALYTRNVLFGFGMTMIAWPVLRRLAPWLLLAAASLLWPLVLFLTHNAPFGKEFGNLDNLTKAFNQQTRPILSFAFQVTKLPFGYILGWLLITGIDIASPMFNFRYYESYSHHVNYAQLALQASSVVFVVLLTLTFVRAKARVLRIEALRLFFVFTLFTGLFPLSQHRYLLPAFPLVIFSYLVATGRGQTSPGILGSEGGAWNPSSS